MFELKNQYMNDFLNKTHTTNPVVIGSSVIGIKYNKGVIIACDNRINVYGYKKYTEVTRISSINKFAFMGSSGEYSDFQELNRILVEQALEDELYDGVNSFLGPKEISNYLSNICYRKRNKMEPYWTTTIIGGLDENNIPYLNSVDQFGTRYDDKYLVSGFALYFAGPILEKNVPKDHTKITKEQAIELIDHVFRVLFYRDSSAGDKIYYGIMEVNYEDLNNPKFQLVEKKLNTNWEYDLFKKSHNERYHPMA